MENSLMHHVADNVRGGLLLVDWPANVDCPANGLTLEPSSIHFFDCYTSPAVRIWHPQASDGSADHHVPDAKRSGRVQHVLRRNRQADTAATSNQQLAVYGYELGSNKARSPFLPNEAHVASKSRFRIFWFYLFCIYPRQLNLPSLLPRVLGECSSSPPPFSLENPPPAFLSYVPPFSLSLFLRVHIRRFINGSGGGGSVRSPKKTKR